MFKIASWWAELAQGAVELIWHFGAETDLFNLQCGSHVPRKSEASRVNMENANAVFRYIIEMLIGILCWTSSAIASSSVNIAWVSSLVSVI